MHKTYLDVVRTLDGSWKPREPAKVRLQRKSFAEGSLRMAGHIFVPSAQHGEMHLVVKEGNFESEEIKRGSMMSKKVSGRARCRKTVG